MSHDHTHSINTSINTSHNHGIGNTWVPSTYDQYRPGVIAPPNMLYGLPLQVNDLIPRGKLVKTPGAIYGSEPTLQNLIYELRRGNIGPQMIDEMLRIEQPTKPKEPEVSTIEKIKQERKEKREREELEAKFQGWDEALGNVEEGDVVSFTADLSGKTYRYAAIFTNKRWYLTGQYAGALAVEDFITFLIEKDVQMADLLFLEPVE